MKKFILKAFSMIMAFALFAGAFLFGNNVSSKVFADGTAVVTVGNIVEAVQPGSDIQIPVTISNNPGFVIGAFDVEYDSNALSPQNPLFVKGSSLDNSVGLTASTSALLESTDPMTNITVNGEILKLCFTVNSDVSVQSTVVSLKLKDNNDENFCNADDDLVPVSFVSGTISLNVNTGSKAVTFYGSDLETSIDTLNVAFDSTLENSTLPTVAAPEGKVFAGWYTSKPTNDGAKVTPNTVLDVHDKVRDNLSVYPVFIEEGNEVMLEAADGSISACSTFKAAIDGDSPVATSTSIIRLVTNVSTAASGSYLYDISSLTYFHVDLNGHNISGDFNSNGPWDCYIFKMEPQLTGFTFENTKSEGKFSPSISNPQSYNGVFGIPSGSSPSGNVEYTFSNVNLTSDSVFIFDSSCTCTFNIDNSTLNQLFYNSLGLGNGWSTITAKLYSGTKYYTGSVTKLKNKATWLLEEGCGTLDYANYSIVVYDAEHYAKVKGYDSNGALTDVGYVHAPVGGTVDAATLNSLATTRASELLTDGFTRRYYTFAGWTTTENGSVVDLSTITYEDTLYPVYSIEDVDARAAEYNGEKYMTIGDALQAAIDANATGQINIKLIQDSSEFVILTEKTPNVVIDLNGKTLSLPTTGKSFEFSDGDNNQLVNSASACFAFIHGENNTDASLTIKDNSGNGGCVYIGDYDWNGYFFATDISKMPVSIQVNIEGGNFVYKDPDKFPPKYPDFKSNHMTASQFCISGGTFKHNITSLVDTDDCDYSYDAGVYTVKTHIFGDAEFAWSNDRSSCIVKRYCTNDGCSHCIEAIATVTSTTKTNATCISQGVTTYTANITIGGNNYSDTKDITDIAIDSNNHDIVHHDAKAATCEAIGWDAYDTCSRCDYSTYVEIPATNHSYVFDSFVWDGFTAKAKYVCENDASHVVYYDATITNEVTTTPTCVATGVKTYTATYDGHTATKNETLAINPDNHDIVHHDAKAATCEAIGWDAYDTCSRCSYTTYVEKSALNHSYVFNSFVWDGYTAKAKYVCENDSTHIVYYDATVTNEVTTTPTCVATGVKTYTATYDGHTDTKNETLAINPDNHDIVHHDAKAATCETIGWDAYDTCSRCSYTTYVEKSALNHDYKFVEFVWDGFTAKAKYVCENDSTHIVYYNATITNEVTTTPTCVATGVKTYTATYDGHTDSKDETLAINPDNHDIVHHDAKAPDCTNIGWDAYDTCSRCSYSTYVEKAALGHKVVIDPAVPATTISTGLTEGAHCSVCKAVLEPQEVVDKLAKPATGEDIVDVVVQPGSNEVETEINSNIFDSTPAEEDNKKVVIKAGDVATIEFDSDAAKAISENADGAKISISIEKSNAADKASEIEAAGVKGAKLVISFELTANDNPVFGVENANGQAVVSFEYTPSNICAQVLVYYINGNERTVVPSELKDGKLYFTASHFSDYVIAEHETHEYHDGLCECGGVAENVKFYFEVSSNNTVSLVVYDDYGAVIRLPLDGSVNTESVLIKAIMQNVSSLDVDGVKSHEITVNTGFGSKTVNLQTWLSNAYNFDGATLNISIDGHELTYTFASIDANNGIVASTDTDAARTAWQSLTSHITTSTQTEDDSFIEIANGSFLKIGTEYLRFEDGYVGNLKLDNFSDLDALETAIRAAVTLDTCADQGGDITLFVKAGTKIAVGQTVAELQDDYMIIISADPDEMDAVDGSLASLKDASGSYETVKELVSLFNKVIGVVDACNSVEVEMHVHEFTHVTANDASCTEDGNIEYWFCENCGKYYSNAAGTVEITSDDTVIGALGHTLTHVTANAPTCVDDGNIEYWYCSECEKYFTDAEATTEIAQAQTVVDALDHDIIHHDAKAPTCTDIGWDAYDTCSRCEYSTYVEKSATNHDYKFVGFVWDGFTAKAIYVCENDADHVVFYDATVTNEVTTTPTCVATGVRTYTATYDGHTDTATETLAIDSDNHNIVHIDAKSPTCTEAGWEAYDKCSRCDYSTKTEIPATNHDYKFVGFVWDGFTAKAVYVCENDADHVVFYDATVTDEVTLTPTCTCIGVKTYTASYDGNTDTKLETLAINPDNHDIVGHNGKAPTCTEDGWHGYDTCSRCDYSTKVVIPATNHNYKFSEFVWDGFTAKAKYVCENDSSHVVYYDAIVTNEVTLTPTCDSTGTKKYTATYDGNEDTKLETLAIDPNNHNIEHHNSKAPDCTTIGWDAYDTCSRCEYSTYVEKSALGHTLVHTYAHDADCHATGNIEFWYCSVCEKYFSDAEASTEITQAQTVIAIKPHTPATEVKENEIAPTCKTTGSYDSVIYCSECHDQISRTTMLVTTTSHNTIHFEGKDATVYSTGNIEYWYCCECKEYFSDSACLYGISKADIEIAKLTATEVTKPTEDTTSYVYNGSEQTYVIADSDKYTVYGNKQTNAGTYTVTVSLKDKLTTCWTGGSIDDLTFSFTIAKTTIDMSGVTFESDALVADGQYHSIYVNGLPINVQVSYSNNNIKNPGTYKIVASFTAGENYNAIPDMEATLTILAKSDEKKTISSNGNSVEGYLPEGSSLDVEVLDKATSEDAKVASTLVENQKNVNAKDVLAVLEVNLSYKGIEIQPNGEIKLTLKVPTSVGDNSFAVYHVHTNEDGTKTVTALDHELNGDKFSVTVDKLSQLVLVKAEATPSENNIPLFFMIGGGAIVLAVLVALIALGVNKKAHRICKSALESEKAETQEAKTEDNN